ncbi:uncharacterized protein klhdc3l [Pholidichthys leucotaenia]
MPVMTQSSDPSLWTRLPQNGRAPCDRYKHACCSYGGNVYVLGGREDTGLRDFWKYSVVCDEWTELNCSGEAAPEELEEHSMVAHQGFLYVFGGMLDSGFSTSRCALWVFDVVKQRWVHWQGKKSCPQMPSNRKGHSAVVLGSSMLMYGGLVDIKGSSQEFWSLNFDTMAWSLLSGSQKASLGPGPRHSHSAVAHQGCMYLFGGLKGLKEQRDFWRWDWLGRAWTSLRCGPPRLAGHSAVAYRDSMLVFGGGNSPNSLKNCLWSYGFSSHTWSQISTLPGSEPPDKIHHCCAGLGPSYNPQPGMGPKPWTLGEKFRPFKNKCYPAPLTFLGSEGAIELETFSLEKCHEKKSQRKSSDPNNKKQTTIPGRDAQVIGTCLTFENQGFRTQWSCSEDDMLHQEDEEEEGGGDICQHLPDLLLVLGGRPWSRTSNISMWQMTLTDS